MAGYAPRGAIGQTVEGRRESLFESFLSEDSTPIPFERSPLGRAVASGEMVKDDIAAEKPAE